MGNLLGRKWQRNRTGQQEREREEEERERREKNKERIKNESDLKIYWIILEKKTLNFELYDGCI